jgi:tetratricopeptide (TPR) repeat protein
MILNLRTGALCALLTLLAVQTQAQEIAPLMQQASQALAAKDFPAAVGLYTQVLAQDAKNLEATYNRAVCWLTLGEHERALEGLNASIALAPDYGAAYLNRGSLRANSKDLPGALADFSRAVALDSMSMPALYMRGQVLLQMGRLPESVLDLRRAHALGGASEQGANIARLLTAVGFAPASGVSIPYTDDAGSVSLELPREWNRKTADDGRTLNMFVSEQKVESETDMYLVGATIHRIRKMSLSFEHIQKDGAWLAGFWSGELEKEGRKLHAYRVISSEKVTVGSYVGVVRLVELQQSPEAHAVRMYEVIVGHDDEIVTVNLEAPAILFADYDKAFKRALGTLVIEAQS